MTTADAALGRPSWGRPYSTRRKVAELAVVLAALAAVTLLYPLSHAHFWVPSLAFCVASVAYAVYGLRVLDGAARRWGFVPQRGRERGIVQGGLWALLSFVAALIPVVAIRAAVHMGYIALPRIDGTAGYLAWCVVQDFIFFSLVLRNLLDFTNRHLAVVLTAGLFALSHYPFGGMMIATGAVALCWGYVFLLGRLLWLVTIPHMVLGLLIML